MTSPPASPVVHPLDQADAPTVAIVYALHDFAAENEDELAFVIGDRIEVTERDDHYGDGWWLGRNAEGEFGLFPEAYTGPEPPPQVTSGTKTPAALRPTTNWVKSANDPDATPMPDRGDMPKSAPMHETLSQLQNAIDEMHPADAQSQGSSPTKPEGINFIRPRSLASKRSVQSLASISSNGSGVFETNWEPSDHTKARALLAQNAKENAQAKARKAQLQAVVHVPEVGVMELSDESDDEDNDMMPRPFDKSFLDTSFTKYKPGTTLQNVQEDDDEKSVYGASVQNLNALASSPTTPFHSETPLLKDVEILESRTELTDESGCEGSTGVVETPHAISRKGSTIVDTTSDQDSAQPEQSEAPATFVSTDAASAGQEGDIKEEAAAVEESSIQHKPSKQSVRAEKITPSTADSLLAPAATLATAAAATFPSSPKTANELQLQSVSRPLSEDGSASFHTSTRATHNRGPLQQYPSAGTENSSRTSSWLRGDHSSRGTTADGDAISPISSSFQKHETLPEDPTEWTVEQVIDWGRDKRFDDFTLGKFAEHQITGDVLLDLDINNLKEVDLTAFGRRLRVSKAIEELKRSRGIETRPPVPSQYPSTFPLPQGQLQTQDPAGLRSPLTLPITTQGHHYGAVNASPTSPLAMPMSPESPTGSEDHYSPTAIAYITRHERSASEITAPLGMQAAQLRGLGLAEQGANGLRSPASQPIASPKALHLRETSQASTESFKSMNEDRGAVSDSEVKRRSKRGATKSGSMSHSVTSSLSVPPSPDTAQPPRSRTPKSSFLGSLRGRKPPPKEPTLSPVDDGFKAGEFANLRSTSNVSNTSHRLSTRIFPFHPAPNSQGSQRQLKSAISQPMPGSEKANTDLSASLKTTRPMSMIDTKGVDVVNPLEQIGRPDHSGWMRKKGERYPTWKMRYFVLKATNLYYLKSETETKLKGHIKLHGFRIIMDADVNPGRYGFRIVNDMKTPHETHSFSSEDSKVVREWMKAIMKATIGRDWSAPVISSYNMDVIPIAEAQQMFPPPRPPSPTSRIRLQKALLPANPEVLTEKDAAVLMSFTPNNSRIMQRANTEVGLRPQKSTKRKTVSSIYSSSMIQPSKERPISGHFSEPPISPSAQSTKSLPPTQSVAMIKSSSGNDDLVDWLNNHLPEGCRRAENLTTSMSSGQLLTRLVEQLTSTSSGIKDEQFEAFDPNEPLSNVDVLFTVFDYLNNHDIPLQGYSLNDLIKGEPIKTRQFVNGIRQKFA